MQNDRWLLAWALGSVAFGGASLLVPLYVVALGGGAAALGGLAAAAAVGAVPGALVVGRLADRTGKRRVYVVGALVLVAAMLFVMPLVESVAVVVLANAVVWFAAAAAAPVLTLLVTVGVPEAEWPSRFGTLNRYGGWGWVGGLVLGVGWTGAEAALGLAAFSQRTFFLACGACAAAAAIGAGRWLPADPRTERTATRMTRALGRARRFNVRGGTFPVWASRVDWSTRGVHPRRLSDRFTRGLLVYFLAVVLFFAGFAAFFAPLPLYLTDVADLSDGAVFGLYLVSSVGSAVSYVGVGRLTERVDAASLQAGGLAARGLLIGVVTVPAAVGVGATGVLGTLGVVFLLVGVTWAVVAVTAATVVTRLSPPALRGEMLGVYGALTGVAGAVGSVVGGLVAARGFTQAFALAGGLVLAGAAVVLVVGRLDGDAG